MVRRFLTASLKLSLLAMVTEVLLKCLEIGVEEVVGRKAFCMLGLAFRNGSLVSSGAARCIASSPCGSRSNIYAISTAITANTAPRALADRSRMSHRKAIVIESRAEVGAMGAIVQALAW